MTTPFTADEIHKAAKSLKNGKSCGIVEVHAEDIKYAPVKIHTSIANMLKVMPRC